MWQQKGEGFAYNYVNEISMLESKKPKKPPKRPKDAKSFRTGRETEQAAGGAAVGGVRCFSPDGTAVGSSPLGSPPRRQMGLPSRDTTTFPPSFSARVLRSWMSSSPFTCHSCLIPANRRTYDIIQRRRKPAGFPALLVT